MADSGKERSRSRSPLHFKSIDDETKSTEETKSKDNKNYTYIIAENLPTSESVAIIPILKKVLGPDRPDKVFFEPIIAKGRLTGQYIFTFNDEIERQKVFKLLQEANYEGLSLNPELDSIKGKTLSRGQIAPHFCLFRDKTPEELRKLDKEVYWGIEPAPPRHETYGIPKQFLRCHKIFSLRRKVSVAQLHPSVDEAKLREVFSLAGQVTSVKIQPPRPHYEDFKGFIEFDHPVEAVQAISMFNNHKLYGQKMVVKMHEKGVRLLPKGLESIGPGLGINGEPLRGVRVAMEIKQLKYEQKQSTSSRETQPMENNQWKFDKKPFIRETQPSQPVVPENNSNQLLAQLSTLLSNTVQGNTQSQNVANIGQNSPFGQNLPVRQNQIFGQHILSNQNPPIFNQNTPNYGHNSNPAPNFNQQSSNFNQNAPNFDEKRSRSGNRNIPIVQSNRAQGSKGSNFRPNGNKQSWKTQTMGMEGGYTGQDRHFTQQNNNDDGGEFHAESNISDKDSGSIRYDNKKPDTLVFTYLPPSVNGQTFNTKMSEVGEVVFGEVTGQGRAIVRFVNPNDADKCIKLFDQSRVDGQIIHVKYL